ncbi:MAG: hypothetical protein JKY56_01350 [Kofleriaceae bacterium]|nr:hypothetical protein [Kofleriaceae bacterium]
MLSSPAMTSDSLSTSFLAERRKRALQDSTPQPPDGQAKKVPSEETASMSIVDSVSLESALASLCHCAEQAWPLLQMSRPHFVACLAQDHDAKSILAMDTKLAPAIFLGHACAAGEQEALRAFDAEYIGRIPRMLSHMKLSPSALDEIAQQVRFKLLVGSETDPPKIASYAGRGKLAGMVQVVATRIAISISRKQKPEVGEEKLLGIASPETDLGLHYIKQQYRSAFKSCFERAVATLSSRDRNLLRLHLLEKVTLEKLAVIYDVHRATIVRWLAKARQDLFAQTKTLLSSELKLEASDFASLMRLIESNLDLSTSRILSSSRD